MLINIYLKESGIAFTKNCFTGKDLTEYMVKDHLYFDLCKSIAIANNKVIVDIELQDYVADLFKIYDIQWLICLYYYYKWNY